MQGAAVVQWSLNHAILGGGRKVHFIPENVTLRKTGSASTESGRLSFDTEPLSALPIQLMFQSGSRTSLQSIVRYGVAEYQHTGFLAETQS